MVEAGLPERVEARASGASASGCPCSVWLKAWPMCRRAGDVRRRQQDAEGLGAGLRIGAGAEGAGRFPGGVDRGLRPSAASKVFSIGIRHSPD